jgi:hypothetical protein
MNALNPSNSVFTSPFSSLPKPVTPRSATPKETTTTEDLPQDSFTPSAEKVVEAEEAPEKLTKDQKKRLYDLMNKRAAKTALLYLNTNTPGIDPNKKLKELSRNPLLSFGWGALFGGGFAGLYVASEKWLTSNWKLNAIDVYIVLPALAFFGVINVLNDKQLNEGIAQFLKIHGQNSKVKDLWKQMSGLEGKKEDLKLKP